MSLIEEALRRAQDPTLPPAPATTPSTAPFAPKTRAVSPWPLNPSSTSSSTVATNALVAVAVAVLGLTIVLIVGGAFWMGRILSGQRSAVADTPSGDATIEASPEAAPPPPLADPAAPALDFGALVRGRRAAPEFALSGIVVGGGEPYAVINGNIVSVGDLVEGLRLIQISEDSVTLRDVNGNDRVLRGPR
mgnify:CR=1 FL=1